MIDLNHKSALKGDVPARLRGLLDEAKVRMERAKPSRRYLGASAVGHECLRATQLDYIQANDLPHAPKAESNFTALSYRIFQMGHMLEEAAAGWWKGAGFHLRTHGKDGEQIGFETAGGRFSGHCDGVLVDGPDVGLAFPALWEHKGLGNRSWQDVVKRGLNASKPIYAAQVAIYQAYLGLQNPAVFHATNRDTGEIYLELVPFNGALAQRMSDRAVQIIQASEAGELLPGCSASSDHYLCRMCRWRGFCWPGQ